jgi:hypothetical protein
MKFRWGKQMSEKKFYTQLSIVTINESDFVSFFLLVYLIMLLVSRLKTGEPGKTFLGSGYILI